MIRISKLSVIALILLVAVLLFALPAFAQDFATNTTPISTSIAVTDAPAPAATAAVTPDMILVPRNTAPVIVNLPDVISDSNIPDAPQVIYVEQPAPTDSGGLTTEQILVIGFIAIVLGVLYILERRNAKLADLVPLPIVQEMIRTSTQSAIADARQYAASTQNTIDDALVEDIARRAARFMGYTYIPPQQPDLPGSSNAAG